MFSKLTKSGLLGKCTVCTFPIMQNLTTIPSFMKILHDNFKTIPFVRYCNDNYCKYSSEICCWIVILGSSLYLYGGNGFDELCNYAGLFFIYVVSLIIPPIIYYRYKLNSNQNLRNHEDIIALTVKKSGNDSNQVYNNSPENIKNDSNPIYNSSQENITKTDGKNMASYASYASYLVLGGTLILFLVGIWFVFS